MLWAKDRKENTDPVSREAACRKRYARFLLREDIMWLGEDIQTGRPLVYTGFAEFNFRSKVFTIGYWVRKSAQRQGFATEVTNALTRYAFEALGANAVRISHAVGNANSRGVIEKLGFTFSHETSLTSELPNGRTVGTRYYERTSTEGLPSLDVTW